MWFGHDYITQYVVACRQCLVRLSKAAPLAGDEWPSRDQTLLVAMCLVMDRNVSQALPPFAPSIASFARRL